MRESRGPSSKGTRRAPLALLLLAVLAASYLLYPSALSAGLGNGVGMGVNLSIATWFAFLVTVGVLYFGLLRRLLASISKSVSQYRSRLRFGIAISVLAALEALYIVQVNGGYLSSLLHGIAQGYVPLGILLLESGVCVGMAFWRLVSPKPVSVPSQMGVSTYSIGELQRTGLREVDWEGKGEREEPREIRVLVGDEPDSPVLELEIAPSQKSVYTRDDIQTRSILADWIIKTLQKESPLEKATLEESFRASFPSLYVSLLNSVLYDLVYKNKVLLVVEDRGIMLALPEAG
jgi:hypothetical protein